MLAKLAGAALALMFLAGTAQAQNVTVSGGSTGDGGHATLAAAISAIGTSGNAGIDVVVTINANLTAGATINEGDWNTLTIVPNGARTIIQTVVGGPVVDLDGADRVTIDGLNTGGNSLSISNQSTSNSASTSTVRFINDASDNVVTNCSILGRSVGVLATFNGNILFAGTSGSTGNDNNTISNCNVGNDGSATTNLISKAIVSDGSTSSLAHHNSGNTITNCNIYNFFLTGSSAGSRGVQLRSGNHQWTITGNRFYQESARALGSTATQYVVEVQSGSDANAGGHTINTNTIGYANAGGTGTYSITNATNLFRGISLDVANTGPRSSISYNVFASMSLLSSNTGTGAGSPRTLIYINSGEADVNNNQFGGQTGTGNIIMQVNSTGHIHGILNVGGTNLVTNHNQFGSITCQTSTSTNALHFYAIRNMANTAWECKHNTIGGSTANSIQANGSSGSRNVWGILAEAGTLTADTNRVRNIGVTVSTSTSSLRGIEATGSSLTAIGNTISGLGISGSSTGNLSCVGISASTSGASTVSGDTISNLSASKSSTGTATTIGIDASGSTLVANGNTIDGLSGTGGGSGARTAQGIVVSAGTTATASNNTISNVGASGSSSGVPFATGINASGTGLTVNYNTIATVSAGSTATGGRANGIVASGPLSATGNTVTGLSCSGGTGSGATAALVGINVTGGAGNVTVDSNLVHTLVNTGTGNTARHAAGIRVSGTGTNVISRNQVYSIRPTSSVPGSATAHGSTADGIQLDGGGSTNTIVNNMVQLGLDAAGASLTTPSNFRGIDIIGATTHATVRHNSVYIGGSQTNTTTQHTHALLSATTDGGPTARDYRNNIFWNARSTTTGNGRSYAIGVSNTNIADLVSDHNILRATGTNGVVGNDDADRTGLADWQSSTGKDANSHDGDPRFLDPEGSVATVDLHIDPSLVSFAESLGDPTGTTMLDIDGQTRSGLTPVDIGADAGNFMVVPNCSSDPDAGTISPAMSTLCPSQTTTLSTDGDNSGVLGVTYQWEQSLDGIGGWTDATGGSGATSPNYTTPATGTSYFYRLRTTCTFTAGTTLSSNTAEVARNLVYAVFDGVYYQEGFEAAWINQCGTNDSPNVNWRNSVATGNNSWRRNDQSNGWSLCIGGGGNNGDQGGPGNSEGDFGARIHTGCFNSTVSGSLDLYIDMTAATANTELRFDHLNTTGTDSLRIWLSDDGGSNFTQLGGAIGISATWTEYSRTLTSTSATTVVRFTVTGGTAGGDSDVGLDNVRIIKLCEGTPPAGAIAGVTAQCASQDATLTFTPGSTEAGISWVWQRSATGGGAGFSDVGTPSSPTHNTGVVGQDWYYQVVTTCSNGGGTSTSTEHHVTWSADPPPTVTVSPVSQNACAGQPAPMTASGADTYAWSPATYLTAVTGATVEAVFPIIGSLTYTVTGTATSGCTGSAQATVSAAAAPYNVQVSPATPAPFCHGGSVDLSATSSIASTADNVSPGVNGSHADLPFSCATYPIRRVTYIFPKSALGIPAGSSLTALTFHVVATAGVAVTNFSLKVGNTASAPGAAVSGPTVWGPGSHTVTTGLNRFEFNNPVVMDGTPNIVVDITYNVTPGTNPTMLVNTVNTTVPHTFSGAGSVLGSGNVPLPRMTFDYSAVDSPVPTFAWTPVTGLTPGTGVGANVNAAPPDITVYTVTASHAGCTSTASVTVTAYPMVSATPGLANFTCGSTDDPDVVFTFTGTLPLDFAWTFNGGAPTVVNGHNAFTYTIPAAPTGVYEVVSLSDPTGCPPETLGGPLLAAPYDNDLFFVYAVGNNFEEVAWSLYQTGSNLLVQTGGVFSNGNGSVPTCLPSGNFYLRVTDSGGDGIAGGYRLITSDGRRIIDNTDNFNSGGVSAIANNGDFNLPLGMDRAIFTSCDKMWWKAGEYFVATENPAVSAVWVNGPNNAQSPTSGYEFWWYDPNGGYSFRRFRPHTESDGFANVGGTRACHVRLNNWAVANHLPPGQFLNVKVRGRVNGVNQNWGEACRFALDNTLAACPPTKLMDIPGHTQYSCGEVRSLERGQRIYARPVRGATHYQWRFRVPAEEPVIQPIVVTTNVYHLHLFTVAGLQYGKTYDVEVRASKDGTVTWCGTGNQNPAVLSPLWGDVCLLTIAPPMTGPEVEGIERTSEGGLLMWPNPNRGDQLWINLDGIAAGVETVTVDLFDLAGKRIVAREIATQGGHLNTVIELNGDLAGGTYLVTITAGDERFVQRLVVQP